MYKIENLNKINKDFLLDLNTLAIEIKEDTYDICTWYRDLPWYKKPFAKRRIKVFKYNNCYIGYGFFIKNSTNDYSIKSFYVKDSEKSNDLFKLFLKTIGNNKSVINVSTIKPNMNKLLQNNDFKIQSKSIEMWLNLEEANINKYNFDADDNTILLDFCENRDEGIRCHIQNSVFENENRIPLIVDDIIFEETQHYYVQGGALFLLKDSTYIGYGQIIIENDDPVIVNVGVLKDYRGMGYGKLLIYGLIEKIRTMGYDRIKIRCYLDNLIALNLYKNIGFVETTELNNWIYRKDGSLH